MPGKDLLDQTKVNLKVREDPVRGGYVDGVTETYTSSPEEMLELMEKGTATRATASTRMNADSSRSYQALLTTSAINMANTKYTPGLTQCSW